MESFYFQLEYEKWWALRIEEAHKNWYYSGHSIIKEKSAIETYLRENCRIQIPWTHKKYTLYYIDEDEHECQLKNKVL